MPNLPKASTFFLFGAALALVPPAAGAAPAAAKSAAWTFGASRAGLAGRDGETIGFSCAGGARGTLRLVFAGFDPTLQGDLDHTVVVTVDGTAYRLTTRAVDGAGGRRDLVEVLPLPRLLPLIDALATGSKAEIASPAGREALSLKGSGKALAALKAACA